MTDRARLLLRIVLAVALGFAAMMIAAELDPRFQPVFASWLSAGSARVPYVSTESDTLLAGLLAGGSFVFLLFGRGWRSARALAAAAVVGSLLAVVGAREARPADAVDKATMPAATNDDPTRPQCGRTFETALGSGRLSTTIACTLHEGGLPDQVEVLQRRDDLLVNEGGRALLVQRVCRTDGVGTLCRWRAGGSPDPVAAPAAVLVELDAIARPANRDDALTVAWLPAFGAFRVREPAGQFWTFAADSHREMLGPILEGHRPGAHPLGVIAVVVSVGGTLFALLALVAMEGRLRRARRFARARTGTVQDERVTFADGSSARVVDGADLVGPVTELTTDTTAEGGVAYRDPELLRRADLACGSALDLAAEQEKVAAVFRVLLLAIVAVTVVPVGVAWVRAGIALSPLPLAPPDQPLTPRP
jgi:hypothetical protein